ncbi:MAG: CalY family protein [Clostridia bacterium]|nr:CalY family protein [Clostridia bacterium]
MKKIIPAITMTLLGASLLGTSTYAWFSANTSATAEGLSIKAQADSSLLISVESTVKVNSSSQKLQW